MYVSRMNTENYLLIFPDCLVLGCRLVLIMEDLLWVLTDDQLKAALHFADSLTGLLKRATEETQNIKGARKLEVRLISSDFFLSDIVIDFFFTESLRDPRTLQG